MFHRENNVLRAGTGIAVPGATVTVYVNGTDAAGNYAAATKATIYPTNVVGTPIAGSLLTADANGSYTYYAPDGVYDEVLKYGAITEVDTGLQMYDQGTIAAATSADAATATAAATLATTKATAASGSAAAASTSEGNATAAANAAAISAAAAAGASGSATAAAASASAASASAAAAAAAAASASAGRAASRAILAAADTSKSLFLDEGNHSNWWDYYTAAAYLTAFGNTAAADIAIDTAQGAVVAQSGGTGVWVRRHNGRLSPYHFGAVGKKEGQTTGWVDDAPALNAWAAWLVSRLNRRVVGEANGKFVINSQVTIGSRTVATRGIQIVGSWELFANAAMDRMLEVGRIDYCQITGQIHLFGGGPNTDSGDVAWASRLAKIGMYNFGCGHLSVDVLHTRFMSLAGYFTAASTGIEGNDNCYFGILRPHYCGSGIPNSTDSLTANYSAPVNNGAAGSSAQTTTLTVDAIPPTYVTDITGGNAAINGGSALPIGAFVNGRVYQVTAVDATHINLYPWIDSTAPTSGTITYIFGAGLLLRGGDANLYEIGQLDGQTDGVIYWDLSLYGASIEVMQASSSGVAHMVNSGRANSNIGGGIKNFYPEANTANHVIFSNFATAVMWKTGDFGQYEGDLSKCYVALVPRAADNSLDAAQSTFAQMGMTYNGHRLVHQGHPGANAYYAKAAIDWSLGTVPQVYAGMGATTVNIHPPLTPNPGGVRPNDDWAGFADLNRLYGYDSSVCLFMGTATSGAPGGAITFQSAVLSRNAVVTNGSAIVTGIASTLGLVAGMFAQAGGSAATTILSVDSATQITLVAAATSNSTTIKLPNGSVNGGATAVFSSFAGAAAFAAYYRFSTNDIIIRPLAGTTPSCAVVAQGLGSAPITGTTAETTVATITLPALGPNDQIYIRTLWSHLGTAGTWTARARLGGAAGTVILGGFALTATNASFHAESHVSNQGATNSQAFYSPGNLPDLGQSSVQPSTAAVETNTGAQTIVISGQLTTSTDTMTLTNYQVIVYRG